MGRNKNAPTCMYFFMISWTIMLMQFAKSGSAAEVYFGVCYGMQGNNLPSHKETVALYHKNNISAIRLFDPNQDVLDALFTSYIKVTADVRNEELPLLAASLDAAKKRLQQILSDNYATKYKYIIVGNNAIPGASGRFVASAMKNIRTALNDFTGVDAKVTTAVSMNVLNNYTPPSAGEFVADAKEAMVNVLDVLAKEPGGGVLLVNAFPYYAYAAKPSEISLDFAIFNSTKPMLPDGNLSYTNMLDAMIDGIHWANEKLGAGNIGVGVSASGWPSAGNGNLTTPGIAATYNKNFKKHIESGVGTPKRPNQSFDGFIFTMYNENLKPDGVEQNFGLFYPNKTAVYNVFS